MYLNKIVVGLVIAVSLVLSVEAMEPNDGENSTDYTTSSDFDEDEAQKQLKPYIRK